MSFDAQGLHQLLPTIHRLRDAEQGGPLRELLGLIAEQVALIEENLDQLYDDQFIETCADWVVPYIGDLVGYRGLHGVAPAISSPRSEVADTIALRRRKGTATMLEQLARDVTGWPARVVEFFQLLATTQYMNHLRPDHRYTADLRRWEPLERLGTPFESFGRTIDLRRIATAKGRYNIPNIGLFLWRLQAYRLQRSPAVGLDSRRFLFGPLGNDTPLFTRPVAEEQISHLAEPINVPLPISRRVLDADLSASALQGVAPSYYGAGKSLAIEVDGTLLPPAKVRACNLSDAGAGWAHQPDGVVALDPVLGRIAFPLDASPPQNVRVIFHYGFGADIGGGPYERASSFIPLQAGQALLRVPQDHATIQAAIDALPPAGGAVEISDNGRYAETLRIDAAANGVVQLRAANGFRPTIVLAENFTISGGEAAEVTLNGLLITAAASAPAASPGAVMVPAGANRLRRLHLRHCTLVPGLLLDIRSVPQKPAQPSLIVAADHVEVTLERSIVGGVRVGPQSEFAAADCIIDATAPDGIAYAAPGGEAGGPLSLRACTVIGKVRAEIFTLVSNCILVAKLATAGETWKAPVWAQRKQEGCVRFSYLPPGARVPRRYRCQPDLEIAAEIERRSANGPLTEAQRNLIRDEIALWLVPGFAALRYGLPAYAQLVEACPWQIGTGADDESEMGAFHGLYQPQRLTNLKVRLEEYLRFGLEAGVFTT
jgi:hypothetical protein